MSGLGRSYEYKPLSLSPTGRVITDRANPLLTGPQFIGVNIDSFRDKADHVTRAGT